MVNEMSILVLCLIFLAIIVISLAYNLYKIYKGVHTPENLMIAQDYDGNDDYINIINKEEVIEVE